MLQERLLSAQNELFVLQDELEKARASARRFEAELGVTKKQLADVKKEVTEQQGLVLDMLYETQTNSMVVVYLPKVMKGDATPGRVG